MDYTEYNDALFKSLSDEKNFILLNPMRASSRSIFGIAESNDKTYSTILSAFERCALIWFEGVTSALCEHYSLKHSFPSSSDYSHGDIRIIKEGTEYNVFFKSTASINSSSLHRIVESIEEPCKFVVLLDDSISSQRDIDALKARIKNVSSKEIDVLNYTDFIRFFFGDNEVESSLENITFIKNKMRSLVGQKITAICTDDQKQSFLKQMKSLITELDYNELVEDYDNQSSDDRLYPNVYDIIFDNYINKNRYSVLLGERDFAESFFTAEWLFVNYPGSEKLDNTYVVSGYLKSIEQLLWNIIFIIGKGKKIGSYNNENIIYDDDSIYTTLGDFSKFLKTYRNDSDDICDPSIDNRSKRFVLDYLRTQIEDFRIKHRNGYFHKDNLDADRVHEIRMKTLLLYCLILGSLNISDKTISKLIQ